MIKKKHPPNNIKSLRKKHDLTAAKLGELIGVSGPYITMLENSQKALYYTRVEQLAKALCCHPDDIMGSSGVAVFEEVDEEDKEMMEAFTKLSADDKERIKSIIESWSK